MKNVIIVESPSKSKTIESYLGKDFKVLASVGHIRELASTGKGGLGIDVEDNFKPIYKIDPKKTEVIKELKIACKNAHVYLATDPDREGEAISYHLADVLGLSENDYDRIVFNEITKPVVIEALNNTRKIDMDIVRSQETRRMIDRIIGYKLSKLMKSKIKSESAGRVQSAALKLICELEQEIEAFIPTPYYKLESQVERYKLAFNSYRGSKERIESIDLANEIKNSLSENYIVTDIEVKDDIRNSKVPYTTSTLQQDASTKLNFSPTRTMKVAQVLYEGKKIGAEHVGLITYMRTDSTRLSDVFVKETKQFILDKYGKEYLGQTKTKAQKLAQDAHEAIRVTSIFRTPELVEPFLTTEEFKLYKLIYNRTIRSLMSPARFKRTVVTFVNNETTWTLTGSRLDFKGYLIIQNKDEVDKDVNLKEFKIGDICKYKDVTIEELFTKPKSRYTEASLIKEMEELGIGRPSTYANTMKTLKDRKYIQLEKKSIIPTEQGKLTNTALSEYFSDIINVKYTAKMEETLDKISNGSTDSVSELTKFWDKFIPLVDYATKNMTKISPVLTDEVCPHCNSFLAVRTSKYGEFLACSNYPHCSYVKQPEVQVDQNDNVDTGIVCPKCGEGHMIQKVAKTGKNKGSLFYACSKFPTCRNTYSDMPTNEVCPSCGSMMLKDKNNKLYCSKKCDQEPEVICPVCKKGHFVKRMATKGKNKGNYFYACSNSFQCKTIFNDIPTDNLCPKCNSMMLKDKYGKLYCSNNNCKYKV